MKKTLIAMALISTFSLSMNVSYAEESVKKINSESSVQLQDPDSITKENLENEENGDKNFSISNIIDEMKNKDISAEDVTAYTNEVKNKINESMVSYFNEIKSSMKILTADNSVASEDIKKRVSALDDKITKTIQSFNEDDKDQKIKDDFQSISQDYIKIIQDYKLQIENKIKEKNIEIKKINDAEKTSSSK